MKSTQKFPFKPLPQLLTTPFAHLCWSDLIGRRPVSMPPPNASMSQCLARCRVPSWTSSSCTSLSLTESTRSRFELVFCNSLSLYISCHRGFKVIEMRFRFNTCFIFKTCNVALKINDSFGHDSLPSALYLLPSFLQYSQVKSLSRKILNCFPFVLSFHVYDELMFSCFYGVDCFLLLMDRGHWSCKNQLLVNSGKKCRTDGWWWW